MAAGGEKPNKLGCLDAARCAVAFAVTVLILLVVVYAVVTVLRPGDVVVSVVEGYVAVKNGSSSTEPGTLPLEFDLTIRVINPSGRVLIYYTGVKGTFSGRINRSLPAEDFLPFDVDDLTVPQKNSADGFGMVPGLNASNSMPPEYFNHLFYGGTIPDAMLKLNGSRVVENYSGHNETAKQAVYYCQSVIVGGEEPEETPADVQCSENLPPGASS